ncbi:MAG: carbohydrate ABC transporter permease, partial [Clostridiales bacterium]|nr:carbohydrate ABC transporter permease [Clostridiales bacterium]
GHARGGARAPKLVIHLLMALICCATLYPFLIVLGSSFQSAADIAKNGYSIIAEPFDLTAYKMVLSNPKQLLGSYWVTAYTTAITAVAGLWVTASYAYVLSRKDYRLRSLLSFYVFFTMLFNGGLVPTYILFVNWLRVKNTPVALILPLLVNAWYILMMKGFMQEIPAALIESAKIEGAGELRIFARIVLPLSKPALATIGLFIMLGSWNDWYQTLLYIDMDKYMKLQYLLLRLVKQIEFLNSAEAVQFGVVRDAASIPVESARMAMCVLAAGPMLAIFPFFQKYFVRGITIGSVKG